MDPNVYEDLALLSLVVESGGFTAASKVSGLTKSFLSRRIVELETRLGVRLIDRTSRRFAATPVGLELRERGAAIRAEGLAALNIARDSATTPRGALRVACPGALADLVVGRLCVDFAERFPAVTMTIDVISASRIPAMDGYDIVLAAAIETLPDSATVARRLMRTDYELVASPDWLSRKGVIGEPADLERSDGIGWWDDGSNPRWQLEDRLGRTCDLQVRPRFRTNHLHVARTAALKGMGLARLPRPLCFQDLVNGSLHRALQGWWPQPVSIFAVYPARSSLTVAGRVFIADLVTKLSRLTLDSRG